MALKGPSRSLLRQLSSTSAPRTFGTASFSKPAIPLHAAAPIPLIAKPFKSSLVRAFASSAARWARSESPPSTKDYLASGAFSTGKPQLVDAKKVLVIGSGGLSIGQAGEFDYSGEHATSYRTAFFLIQSQCTSQTSNRLELILPVCH